MTVSGGVFMYMAVIPSPFDNPLQSHVMPRKQPAASVSGALRFDVASSTAAASTIRQKGKTKERYILGRAWAPLLSALALLPILWGNSLDFHVPRPCGAQKL